MDRPYYFADVDKSRNLKRGSAKKYLPGIAQKRGYVFRMAGKTFTPTSNQESEIGNQRYEWSWNCTIRNELCSSLCALCPLWLNKRAYSMAKDKDGDDTF